MFFTQTEVRIILFNYVNSLGISLYPTLGILWLISFYVFLIGINSRMFFTQTEVRIILF